MGFVLLLYLKSLGFYYGLIEALNMEVKHYTYFDREHKCLNFEGLIKDLSKAEAS